MSSAAFSLAGSDVTMTQDAAQGPLWGGGGGGVLMSHVDFKILVSRALLSLRNSPVELKKCPFTCQYNYFCPVVSLRLHVACHI